MRSFVLVGVVVALPIASAQDVDARSRIVTLHPVDGDDTLRLQTAFDLCAALGPGCTVRLAAGTFYVGAVVSRGFDGVVAGSGHGVSIIEPVHALEGRRDGVVTASAGAASPITITFVDANVMLVALSVHVPVVHVSSGAPQSAAAPRSGGAHQRRGGGGRCVRTTTAVRLDDGRAAGTSCS